MKVIKTCLIVILLFLAACVPYKYVMNNQFNDYYTKSQVDSICTIERLPDLDQWKEFVLINDKDQSPVFQYLYVVKNDSMEYTYTLSNLDTIYRFKKRITKRVSNK